MNVGLIAVDSDYPNLALMKLARWHKAKGENVEWYTPFNHYDVVYMAKVFSFTPDYGYVIGNADTVVKGGTGYDVTTKLPADVDALQPDYSIYPSIDSKTAYGFTTRGCIRNCKWCVVPKKEGKIKPYMSMDEIAIDGRTSLILMDNNVLASDYALQQMEIGIKRGYRLDYNQAIDARLVTDEIAEMLAKVRWLKYIRFGCDTPQQIGECERAIQLIRKHGYKGEFFLYCILLDDFSETFERVNYWHEKGDWKILPFCQPYRDPNGKNYPPQWQKDLARWADRKEIFKTTDFKDYEPRKGFKCKEYFKIKL